MADGNKSDFYGNNLGKETSSSAASSTKLLKEEVKEEMNITSDDNLPVSVRALVSSNASYRDMDARQHLIKKHKGQSFDLPTSHESFEKSKVQKTRKLNVGISPISPRALAISDEVDFNGYKVKAATATMLKAVFAKYGDITANCSCKSLAVKTSLLEVLCNTVQKLQCSDIETVVSNLESIENEVLDLKDNNINLEWLNEDLEKLRKLSACCDKSLQLKEEVENRGTELSSLNEEVEQKFAELEKLYGMFEEAKQRVADMKLTIQKIEENVTLLEAEKSLLIQGLFSELP